MQTIDYVWLDSNKRFRWKTRIYSANCIENVPEWNYDGSSCGQTGSLEDTEVILKPIFICQDPFRNSGASKIVLCETYKRNMHLPSNTRGPANMIFLKGKDKKPWFGIEQEYFIVDPLFKNVMGCHSPDFTLIPKQGEFYCKMGNKWGREIAEQHLQYCLRAGLKMSGMNAEVAPGQWEYQIGPCEGIEAADQLLVSRYILERIAEEHGKSISWSPKISPKLNGSGCHINFSTEKMRNKDGITEIVTAISYLKANHAEHMLMYGEDNVKRMTGDYETSSYYEFTWGYGTRNTSIRIGNETVKNKKGYFEDRRPAANMDPYLATGMLLKTSCNITI